MLRNLIENLELEQADRYIDGEVLDHLGLRQMAHDELIGNHFFNCLNGNSYNHPAPVTSNLQAAYDLKNELFFAADMAIESQGPHVPMYGAVIIIESERFDGMAENPAAALCMAVLKAKEAETKSDKQRVKERQI